MTAASVVHFMPLANNFYGVAVLAADSLSGSVIFAQSTNAPLETVDLSSQSERVYKVQSERISNFVVYSDSFFYWANLDYAGDARSVKLENNDIDTGASMVAIALSSNKLTVLYDARIDYYAMFGESEDPASISLIFSKDFTGSDIEGEGVYRFGISCVCQNLKRFSCYSSTLNCLLIKKGSGVCGGKDLPTPTIAT